MRCWRGVRNILNRNLGILQKFRLRLGLILCDSFLNLRKHTTKIRLGFPFFLNRESDCNGRAIILDSIRYFSSV